MMDLDKLSGVKHISEWLPTLVEELYARGEQPALSLKTLPEFNRKIWGLRQKGLTVVGARTSQGKSSFALQIANDLASQRIPVWLLSLEMDIHSLIERLFCHVMSVDNYALLSGQLRLDKGIQRKFLQFKRMLQDSTLLITEGIGKSWEDIHQMIEAVGDKPKVVIVDYVQNIAFRSGDTREIINEYIRRFRNMAIKHNFAGVLCSQINRGAEANKNNEPTLSQLKETGFLEESADVVMLLYWKAFYEEAYEEDSSHYQVEVAKNRNGKTGKFNLIYTPKYYRFEEKNALYTPPDYQSLASNEETFPTDSVQKVIDLFGARIIDADTEMPRSNL